MNKVYEIITDQILAALESGTVPWQKPWTGTGPKNLASKKGYRGINSFLLSLRGFSSPYWVTFNQCKDLGGMVKAGEKSTKVILWKPVKKGENEEKSFVMLRYFNVFNVEQTTIDPSKIPALNAESNDIQPIEACAAISRRYLDDSGPTLKVGGAAFYRPSEDSVTMPPIQAFRKAEEYYSTLFHEITHSTGNGTRLNRPTMTDSCPFGSTNYSKEELIAEMGAAMLCGVAGIANVTIDNSAAYIASWLGKLRSDPKLVISAAAQAQKAADLILGTTFEVDAE